MKRFLILILLIVPLLSLNVSAQSSKSKSKQKTEIKKKDKKKKQSKVKSNKNKKKASKNKKKANRKSANKPAEKRKAKKKKINKKMHDSKVSKRSSKERKKKKPVGIQKRERNNKKFSTHTNKTSKRPASNIKTNNIGKKQKSSSVRSKYKTFYKQKKYNTAYVSWVKDVKTSSPQGKVHLINEGEKILNYKVKHASNPTTRKKYAKQLGRVYDYQYRYYKSPKSIAKKGLVYYHYWPENIIISYNSFAFAIRHLNVSVEYEVLKAFMDVSLRLFYQELISQNELERNYIIVQYIVKNKSQFNNGYEVQVIQNEMDFFAIRLQDVISVDDNFDENALVTDDYDIALIEDSATINIVDEADFEGEVFELVDEEEEINSDIDSEIPERSLRYPNRYALIIGNEDYTRFQTNLSSESNVSFARNDAKSFATYCEKTLGIPKENITILYDAISSQMRREIKRFVSKAQYGGSDIELYFYFSGHGFPNEKKESFIMPVDLSGAEVNEAIKLSDLYKDFSAFSSNKVTLVLDACFSGGGRNQGLLAAKVIRVRPKENLINGNLVVFSASSGNQESLFYNEKNHGMFTYFFLKKLQDSNGEVSYGEMYRYLKDIVPFTSIDKNYKEQSPKVNIGYQARTNWENWKF